MTDDISADTGIDEILTEVGAFGLFQVVTYILLCIPSTLSATYQINYMFSANTLDYRCKVPECDDDISNRELQYDQTWLHLAIPSSAANKTENCVRYAPISWTETSALQGGIKQCNSSMFNTSQTIACSEYVYASDERNIQTEFDIHCMDSYKLAMIGTVGNIGRFIFLPLVGFLSDRFGRLTVVIVGLVFGSVFGLMKSFANTYIVYIVCEFLESFGTTTFAGTFTLAIEWVNSKYRVLGSLIVSLAFPVGEMLLGTVAMYVHDFRYLIRILYTPGLFLIVYLWILPESIRWLLVTGRVDRAIKILKTTAIVNGKELSEKSIDIIKTKYSMNLQNNTDSDDDESRNKSALIIKSFRSIFQSKSLSLRFLLCCYQFVASCFCYYGLSLSALNIPGMNRYTSFILVVAFEIPGIFIAIPLLKRMKRRTLMFIMFLLTAFSTIVTPFIPEDMSILVLFSFMLAKTAISCTFNVVYVFTAEMWPTNIRTTVMNICSMIGRVGSMVAPITAILATQYESLPAFLFGITAIIGALLSLLLPETFSRKLPDTIDEAKMLSKESV